MVPVRLYLGVRWRRKSICMVRLGSTLAVVLGLLVPLLLASYSSAQTLGWTAPVNISNTMASSWFPALTVDSAGGVHVVWTENFVDQQRRLAVDSLLYTMWDGESWSAPNDLYISRQTDAYTLRPSIITDRTDTLHLLYRYPTTIYHTRAMAESAWSVQAWSVPRQISGSGQSSWTDIAIDSKGKLHAIWSEIVTYVLPGGVSVLLPGDTLSDKADDIWATYTQSSGLAGDDVLDIVVDPSGLKWFAADGGLNVLSADNNRWMAYTAADGLVSEQVQKVVIDELGNKWLATQRGVSVLSDGATPFDKSDDVWTSYTAADGLGGDNVLDIAVDVIGQVWFATNRGASVLSVADGEWMTFTAADGLASDFVQAVLVDQAGYIWFGTQRGVSVLNDGGTLFDKADDNWMTYTADYTSRDGLPSGNVLAMAIGDRGRKWFGTASGLSLLHDGGTPFYTPDDVWTAYTTRDGLLAGQATAITTDADGNIWVGTSTGVSVLSPNSDVWVSYTVDDGVVQSFISAVAVDLNGGVWLGTRGGGQEYLSSDVFYRQSADGGQTWSYPKNLSRSRSPIGESLHLHIDVKDVIHAVWDEAQSCGYTFSSDGGETWAERATFYSRAGRPRQIVSGLDGEGKVLIVWRTTSESTGTENQLPIYYRLSSDSGVSWSEPAPIPNLLARAFNDTVFDTYDMAVDSAGHVHLVVVGRTNATDERLSVLHTEWDGNRWSGPEKLFSTIDFPERPAIAIGGGNQLHVAWFVRDTLFDEGANYEVWYARGQSAAPFVPPPPSPTPLPIPTATPTPVPLPSPTPYPTLAPGTSGLPTGLYTESDEILQLAVALLPLVLLTLVVAVVRFGGRGKLFR